MQHPALAVALDLGIKATLRVGVRVRIRNTVYVCVRFALKSFPPAIAMARMPQLA